MKRLFIVEFGKPDNGWTTMGTRPPVYVIATSYDEAAKKATVYAESKSEKQSVIDSDGSLNMHRDECPLSVRTVKLAAEEIVW